MGSLAVDRTVGEGDPPVSLCLATDHLGRLEGLLIHRAQGGDVDHPDER
jgi:hypothetical protein